MNDTNRKAANLPFSETDPAESLENDPSNHENTTSAEVHPIAKIKTKRIDMKYLARALIKYNASDLHIKPGRPPLYRLNGKLIPAKMDQLSTQQVQEIIYGVLSERQIHDLNQKLQIDFSFQVEDLGRFRCNAFYQKGYLSAVVRMIPISALSLEELGVPLILKELCQKSRGLILITGATGTGKSTTLAAVIEYINQTRATHILTIEDPIEFIFKDTKASITQREIGSDAHTFQDAVLAGLRQDPDILMVGEMRDPETIQTVLTAAETGHLVLATLHTFDAKGTIDRILDVFPANAQNHVRIRLASTLVAVVSQKLLLRADNQGRVVACEVMIKSPAIEQYILKNEIDRIPEAMANSSGYYKMQTLNQDLLRLIKAGVITEEEGLKASHNPDDLQLQLSGIARES